MAARLCSLEWEAAAFRAGTHRWSVMLTTPKLAPSYIKDLRTGAAMAVCNYEERRIWIDAGYPDEFADTLHHELQHVFNPDTGDADHRFFIKTSPRVVEVYQSWGYPMIPTLPEGWQRLMRSSQAWHRKQEESA